MSDFQVPEPIINSPFAEPQEHWHIVEGEMPQRLPGRRPAFYYYRDPKSSAQGERGQNIGTMIRLLLVNRIRERVSNWRIAGCPGASRTTLELLAWWRREGREQPLFFAQLEAAETIIFLTEARDDFLQGISIPRDEPSDEKKQQGYTGFLRYACKMATGAGKTTVMGMVAAWSILNKVNARNDKRFSDVVLIVCPNVTIRDRLRELDPEAGDASLYRTRDLVPPHLMPLLTQGRVLIRNWHSFEVQATQTNGVTARVVKAGVRTRVVEVINIGPKTTTARGSRYLTQEDFDTQVTAGLLTVLSEEPSKSGGLRRVKIESFKYQESDTKLVQRVLGRDVSGKRNILVMNDEAHHAYRIRQEESDETDLFEADAFADEDEAEEFFREATVWVEGLDRIQKRCGINFCLDLSATPYFLGRVGQAANRPFPWVVSDFSLIDAIESGLVKIPQLAVRDTSGKAVPGYFNIWHWILPQLSPSERGGAKGSPKPEAILKYAHTPLAMLGGLWEQERQQWEHSGTETRPPVFIVVCKNTQIARVIYEWLAEDKAPIGIPPAKIAEFVNRNDQIYTIRVDSKVAHETDTGETKDDKDRWMRYTLDTVGRPDWPRDAQSRPLYPAGFEELAHKLHKPLHPPGRGVRCIVSVGMLTEGWDCNTVTHIIGLRPFMSQLLCEQVVGRGLRRTRYELNADGKFAEEVAHIFGVPFEVVPFKINKPGNTIAPIERHYVRALPEKATYEITFPRVEGYTQAIRNRIAINWNSAPPLNLDPENIPTEVQMKAALLTNSGRPSLIGPGKLANVTLNPFRAARRVQELAFDVARTLTKEFIAHRECEIPPHVLFPQILCVVQQYLEEKVEVTPYADKRDLFLAPYYGWVIERLLEAIGPDTSQGEPPEIPRYEVRRGPGSTADVAFWTRREVREVVHSHINFVVADTARWEQSAAYQIDTHVEVAAFVKNAGLGFAIPYLYNGQTHDYVPDFLIRLKTDANHFLILETKGYDTLKEEKRAAAHRWVAAVNADGKYGHWQYAMAEKTAEVSVHIMDAAKIIRQKQATTF